MQSETQFLATFQPKIGLYKGFITNDTTSKVYLNTAHQILRKDLLAALGPNFGDSDADTYTWFNNLKEDSVGKVYRVLQSINQPELLQRQWVFQGEASIVGSLIGKAGRFLGTRIRLKNYNSVATILRVGLQVTGALDDFPIYLFADDQIAPLKVVNMSGDGNNRTVWVDFNTILSPDKVYRIGYFESDLPSIVQVVGNQKSFSTACGSCLGSDKALALSRNKYIQMEAVSVTGQTGGSTMTWPESSEVVSTQQTWGLNYILSAECNRDDLMLDAVLYQTANDALEYFMTTDRLNGVAAQLQKSAYSVLYGQDGVGKTDTGVKGMLANALKVAKNALASNDCCKVEAIIPTIEMYND